MIFDLKEEGVGYFDLQGDILIEKFKLISKVSPDNLLVNPNMRQGLAGLFKHNFELFGCEAAVLDRLEGAVAAKHLEIEMLPTLAHPCKLRLAFPNREKLHNNLK